jgi:anti-sigma factor RsiW
MTSQVSCPRPERWVAHLDNRLTAEERAQMLARLDVCSACRQTQQELAAGQTHWVESAEASSTYAR